ncbi:MAG: hypothetical protein LBK76_09900 [Verrucomicrobiales bacterium]|jgi:hypothetical protein|nr:hypothetical protein [Verrucomicrobiales bacterium]
MHTNEHHPVEHPAKDDVALPVSPIKRFPALWQSWTLDQKTDWLVADGQAADWHAARSLLSRHGHVVYQRRKYFAALRAAREQKNNHEDTKTRR